MLSIYRTECHCSSYHLLLQDVASYLATYYTWLAIGDHKFKFASQGKYDSKHRRESI